VSTEPTSVQYYDPSTQQFLTVDPLVGITGQPYGYTAGDPLNIGDPTGLWGWGDVTGFVHQNAGTIVTVGAVVAGAAILMCIGLSLGLCGVPALMLASADLALGGWLIGGGTLLASMFLPPGEGAIPDSLCPLNEGGSLIYRGGSRTDWQLTDHGTGVSFRDSLSNPVNGPAVLRPGEKYFAVNTRDLPAGSWVPDNNPPGHVSVYGLDAEVIRRAIVEEHSARFPK
jgi:hypothetical protein